MIVMVGEKQFAIQKIWKIITIANQWTLYTANILSLISLNANSVQEQNTSELCNSCPFCLNDGTLLSTDSTGFVYCLVSKKN